MSTGAGRLSRPSSATSHSSRLSNATYGNHSSQASRASHLGNTDLKTECKAAYVCVLEDTSSPISSKKEFILVLQQTGRNPLQKVIQQYWESDRDSMSFEEFVDVCRKIPPTTEDDLMKAFKKIDINGDGYISLDELYKIMTTKGERMTRQEVKAMIDEVDTNKDGRLDYKEFCRMFMSTTEECKKLSLRAMEKKEQRRKRLQEAPAAAPRRDERKQSQSSLRSDDKKLSQASLRSAGRSGSKQSLLSIDDLPKPSPRGGKTLPLISNFLDPAKIKDWHHSKTKGCFFVDENKGFVSHQYQLRLTEDTFVWITIQPLRIGDSLKKMADAALYVLSEDDDAYVAFTEQKDSKGCCGVRCELTAGFYTLVPFTTGCRLQPRLQESSKEAKLVTRDKENKVTLTKPFVKALEEIFDISDLDSNGLLGREEFNWFNIRTSDEAVADDEWQVVEENVELAAGEITKHGFVTLNQMEAEDNDGDTEDLWITLNNMGYNKALEMDEACPFLLNVYAEDGEAILKVTELENPGKKLENAVCASVIAKGEVNKLKAVKDLAVYTYVGDTRATVVVENKSRTKMNLELDFSKSRNCISNLGNSKVATLLVQPFSKKVAAHFLPEDERDEWSIRCAEPTLK